MIASPTCEHVIAVFGAPALGSARPGGALSRRLQCALGLAIADPYALVIVSGAAVSGPVEAEVMCEWLTQRDIARDRIVVEPCARNTFENAAFVAALLARVEATVVTLVTERFHMRRSARVLRWALDDAGIAVVINPVAADDHLGRAARVRRALVESIKLGIDRGRRASRRSASGANS